MVKIKKILVSFVGVNDLLDEGKYGPILSIFKNGRLRFDEVELIYNPSLSNEKNFYSIAVNLRNEIIKKGYSSKVYLRELQLEDVTDHNEIYVKLLELLKSIEKSDYEYTAAISSGTPSMQVCWILIGESGEFPLKLIRTIDPKYSNQVVKEVKLEAHLPRIIRYKNEINKLKKSRFPDLNIYTEEKKILIGDQEVSLSPTRFVYYLYFAQKVIDGRKPLVLNDVELPREFFKFVLEKLSELYTNIDSVTDDLTRKDYINKTNFLSHISKINKEISNQIEKSINIAYKIQSKGQRFNKSYELFLPKDKIKIL